MFRGERVPVGCSPESSVVVMNRHADGTKRAGLLGSDVKLSAVWKDGLKRDV